MREIVGVELGGIIPLVLVLRGSEMPECWQQEGCTTGAPGSGSVWLGWDPYRAALKIHRMKLACDARVTMKTRMLEIPRSWNVCQGKLQEWSGLAQRDITCAAGGRTGGKRLPKYFGAQMISSRVTETQRGAVELGPIYFLPRLLHSSLWGWEWALRDIIC